MNFFITGLPRSRTAWMANFFTTQGNFCFHEGIDGCESLEDYSEKLKSDDYVNIGDSNTYYPYINMGHNDPIVVILRDKAEVNASLKVIFGEHNYMPVLEETESRLLKLDALFVKFGDVNNQLEAIWNHCIKDYKFDAKRAFELSKMRVQTMHFNFNQNTMNKFKEVLPCLSQ